MAPVTPQHPDAQQQLFESYLTYLRDFDRGSVHQQEHVRLHVLPALGHCVSQPNVADAPVSPQDVKREDLKRLCDKWELAVRDDKCDHVPRKDYESKPVKFARLVGRLACCLNLHLSAPVTFSGELISDVDTWIWRRHLYQAHNMYTKFTGGHKMNISSTVAFVRMFKECMEFGDKCKTDPECLALQRQLDQITRGAAKVSMM